MIVLGGAMHPDEEERHGWLRPSYEYSAACSRRHACARRLPRLAADARAAGASVFRSPEPEVGWLPVELTEAAATDPVAASLPERFDAFQSPLHARAPGRRRRAGAQPRLPAGVPARAGVGVEFHPEVRAAQVEAWLSEDPEDVADPQALRAATRERIDGWNELGRRLCAAF